MSTDDKEKEYLEELKELHQRRYRILEQQAAREGRSTPPEIQIELEDIRAKIMELDHRLAGIPLEHYPPSNILKILKLGIPACMLVIALASLVAYSTGLNAGKKEIVSTNKTTQSIIPGTIADAASPASATTIQTTIPISGHVLLYDNFSDNRPIKNTVASQFPRNTSNISFTMAIEHQQYVITANKVYPNQAYKAGVDVQDFDATIDIGSIIGNSGFVQIVYRGANDNWQTSTSYELGLWLSPRKNINYTIYSHLSAQSNSNSAKVPSPERSNPIPILSENLQQIRISCRKARCDYFFNGDNNPFHTEYNHRKIAGDIELWIEGDITIKLKSITIVSFDV